MRNWEVSYIKYERNFTQEDHQHPLNVVWKTKNSQLYDACSKSFQGNMAITCTQCKFIVHCQLSRKYGPRRYAMQIHGSGSPHIVKNMRISYFSNPHPS